MYTSMSWTENDNLYYTRKWQRLCGHLWLFFILYIFGVVCQGFIDWYFILLYCQCVIKIETDCYVDTSLISTMLSRYRIDINHTELKTPVIEIAPADKSMLSILLLWYSIYRSHDEFCPMFMSIFRFFFKQRIHKLIFLELFFIL